MTPTDVRDDAPAGRTVAGVGRGLDALGLALLAVAVGWIAVVGGWDRETVELAALLVAGVGAVLAGRRLARRMPWAVPLVVAVAPLALAALPGRSLLGDGAAGYANASGALYLVAAAGAATLALRTGHPGGRRMAAVVAAGWGLGVMAVRADTLLVFVGLLALLLLARSGRAARPVLAGGLLAVVAALALTTALGATYQPGPRVDTVARVVDATMSPTRAVLWHEAVSAVAERPLTGRGLGSFDATDTPAVGEQAAFAHNELLHVAAETGLAGGALVAGLLVWAFAVLWLGPLPRSALPAVVALVGIAVQANIDYVLHFPSVVVALGALVGAGADLPPGPGDALAAPAARFGEPALTAAAAAVVAVLALAVVPSPVNPPHTVANGAEWVADGVRFADDGVLRSVEEPHELYRALTAEPGLTVEAWAATAETDQEGPARLLSSSTSIIHRNLTLGQDGDALVVRLRTTETGWNAVDTQVEVGGVFADTRRHHLVVVHDGDGLRVHVDGELRRRAPRPSGSLATWNFTYPLLLGNEEGGSRAWHGRLETVAFYDEVVPDDQVRTMHAAGDRALGEAAARQEAEPVARYTFARPSGRMVRDTSSAGRGPALVLPERFAAPADGFAATFLGGLGSAAGAETLIPSAQPRAAAHVLVFALLGLLGARATGSRWPRLGVVVGLTAASAGLALAIGVVGYLGGGSPSVTDVVGAVVGSALGAGAWVTARRRWV